MKRYIAFPAVAATVWAQQAGQSEAEKALRVQVDRFYQLMLDKKYREAEKLVADQSKDDYYNGGKPEFESVKVLKVEMLPDRLHARVTMSGSIARLAFGTRQIFESRFETHWMMEGGEWRWFIDKQAGVMTPFGRMNTAPQPGAKPDMTGKAPELDVLMNSVHLDRETVTLSANERVATVKLSNDLPGQVSFELTPASLAGISIVASTRQIPGNGSASVEFRMVDREKATGGTVQVIVAPLGRSLPVKIQVQ